MREFLTVISYIAIFIFLFVRAHSTGIIDGSIMLLLAPFLFDLAAGAVKHTRAALKACIEESEDK